MMECDPDSAREAPGDSREANRGDTACANQARAVNGSNRGRLPRNVPEGGQVDALKTDLCGLLGVELPIVQAPIGSASCPALAAAVSNAGGLGMLALSWTDENSVRRAIRETRE